MHKKEGITTIMILGGMVLKSRKNPVSAKMPVKVIQQNMSKQKFNLLVVEAMKNARQPKTASPKVTGI
jgi:hypothetical protein